VLEGVVAFLGAPADPERISRAVANNTLARMREKEDQAPVGRHFARTVKPEIRFVGSGSASGWHQDLTPAQVAALERKMGETLERLGYPTGSQEGARR
jgi:hypothetical protein